MRILDINGIEISSPDLALGYLTEEEIFVAHHNAVDAVEEQWHYEVIAEYPNGGKDVQKVVDIEGIEAREAWDEYENIQRYILFTEEELKAKEEELNRPSQLDIIEAQVTYTAMMTDTLLEV